jgi:predicted ATPase
LAQRLSHPISLAFAEGCVGILHQYRREARSAQEYVDSVMALSAERGLTELLAFTTALRGWVMAEQGGQHAGIGQMQEGLAALRATRNELVRPYFLCLFAEACRETNRLDAGLNALTEALAAADA